MNQGSCRSGLPVFTSDLRLDSIAGRPGETSASAALVSGVLVGHGEAECFSAPRPRPPYQLRPRPRPHGADQTGGLQDGRIPGQRLARRVDTSLAGRWPLLAECGLPDTVVHGDFHPGNWRADGGPPVVADFADAYWGNPVLDALRLQDFLPEPARSAAARAWVGAWKTLVPTCDPARALALAEPLAHLAYAVRYQEFLDGIEASERPYHEGDPAAAIRQAVRHAGVPSGRHAVKEAPLASGVASRQDPSMDVGEPLQLPSPLQLQGFDLRLREWRDDDATALVAVYDNPEVARWTPIPSPFDTDTALAYLAAAQAKRADGRGVQLAITTDGRRPLGEVLLFRSLNDPRDVEIAYGVGPAHRGQGLASKAVRLVTEYATRHLNPRRVVLRIEAENTASEAVARSAGFELTDDEPVLRRHKDREVALRTWCLR